MKKATTFLVIICFLCMQASSFASVVLLSAATESLFSDDFDPITQVWTSEAAVGTDDWQLSTAQSHSPTHSYFSSNSCSYKDDRLITSAITLPSGAALIFWHTYDFESSYDGARIEISTDGGGNYTDIGSLITQGGYDGTCAAPFSGSCWNVANIGTMTQVIVDLSTYAGQSVRFRFRQISDGGVCGVGWYIDDVSIGPIP